MLRHRRVAFFLLVYRVVYELVDLFFIIYLSPPESFLYSLPVFHLVFFLVVAVRAFDVYVADKFDYRYAFIWARSLIGWLLLAVCIAGMEGCMKSWRRR